MNSLLSKLLIFLAEGRSFSHGENLEGAGQATEYLDAIYFLNQEGFRMLSPEVGAAEVTKNPKPVVVANYKISTPQRKESYNFSSVSDNKESRMSDRQTEMTS